MFIIHIFIALAVFAALLYLFKWPLTNSIVATMLVTVIILMTSMIVAKAVPLDQQLYHYDMVAIDGYYVIETEKDSYNIFVMEEYDTVKVSRDHFYFKEAPDSCSIVKREYSYKNWLMKVFCPKSFLPEADYVVFCAPEMIKPYYKTAK